MRPERQLFHQFLVRITIHVCRYHCATQLTKPDVTIRTFTSSQTGELQESAELWTRRRQAVKSGGVYYESLVVEVHVVPPLFQALCGMVGNQDIPYSFQQISMPSSADLMNQDVFLMPNRKHELSMRPGSGTLSKKPKPNT